MLTIDVFSDPVCPWCRIGLAYLDRALAERRAIGVALRWHPFQLNPDMPPEGIDRRAYLEAKFGGPEGAAGVYGRIAAAGAAAGVAFDFDRIARTPNTLDAHRLIRWAGSRASGVTDALMQAYFVAGRDIADGDVLAAIGMAHGVADVSRRLCTDEDRDAVAAADAAARRAGIRAVPTFVVGGTRALEGAQTSETWLKLLDSFASELVDSAAQS